MFVNKLNRGTTQIDYDALASRIGATLATNS